MARKWNDRVPNPARNTLVPLVALLFFVYPSFSQNTKGDRPVNNQRQVRETKVKSYKRKEKGSTRDIANRRLRTKDKSSANRANAQYPRTTPYVNRKMDGNDKPSAPRGRVFTNAPRESKVRAWKGDVSGYPMKRLRPTNSDAARNNVYPQKGPYVRYARRQPKARPPVYSQTIKGNPFVVHEPRRQERAWQGGLDHGPLKNQSATGRMKNTYSQEGKYVAYYQKRRRVDKEKAVSNRQELSRVKRLSRPPQTGFEPAYTPASSSKPFVQRGRKNVYWGKFQRKEKGVTSDLTGGPLRTRNYRSMPAGLIGRDTVKFFGKKPLGDRSMPGPSGGFKTATKKGQRGWKGDVAGYPLRGPRAGKAAAQSLTPTPPGIGADWIAKTFNRRFKGVKPPRGGGGSVSRKGWNNKNAPVGVSIGGIGTAKAARFQGNIPSSGAEKIFGDQGTGYAGNIKQRGKGLDTRGAGYAGNLRGGRKTFGDQTAGYSGNLKRWRQLAPNMNYAGYSGNIRGGGKTFEDQGTGYSGNIKRREGANFSYAGYSGNIRGGGKTFEDPGTGYSGNLKRWRQIAPNMSYTGYSGNLRGRKTFSDQGEGYSGNIRKREGVTKLFEEPGFDYQGNIKRWKLPGKNMSYVGYSGNLKRWQLPSYTKQGAGFAGTIKAQRPDRGGGSASGKLWNNRNQSVSRANITPNSIQAGRYKGDLRRVDQLHFFERQGANYSGNIKIRKPEKGGGSASGTLWNNNNRSVSRADVTPNSIQAGKYRGDLRRSVNQHFFDRQGANYSGNIKYRKPDKGGGSASNTNRNNNNTPIPVRTPLADDAKAAGYAGKIPLSKFRKEYIQNPNASKESLKKHRPDETTYKVAGLQVRVKEGDFRRKPNASKEALPGVAPTSASVKASEYARGMKVVWDYKHNPGSSRKAIMGIAPTRATERASKFAGRTKARQHRHNPNSADDAPAGIAPTKSAERSASFVGRTHARSYKHNPNSSKEALNVLAPGKATARIGDFQGNLKMHKYTGHGLHPDAQFAHGFQDNVKGERTFMMNVKLMWGKLFRKSETQPDNLKEKVSKPHYDKREKGLWAN